MEMCMKKIAMALLTCGLSCCLYADGDLNWQIISAGCKGLTDLKRTDTGTVVRLTNADGLNNYVTVFADLVKPEVGIEKLSIRYQGDSRNGKARLSPVIAISDEQDRWTTFYGPGFQVDDPSSKTVDLLLPRDFKVPASNGKLRQIKMVLQSENEPAGKVSQVTIQDIRLGRLSEEEKALMEKKLHWRIIEAGTHGKAEVKDTVPGATITLQNIDGKDNYVTAFAECKLQAAAQKKLIFRYRGRESNGNAFLTPVLTVCRDNQWLSFTGPAIKLDNKEYKSVVLGLNTDFKLGDAVWDIRQIKLVLNATSEGTGARTAVDIADLMIVDNDEVKQSGQDFLVIPMPVAAAAAVKTGLPPIRVYFELDNDDQTAHLASRTASFQVDDNVTVGFRDILLENTGDLFRVTATPEDAEVIVYARALPGAQDDRIAAAVKQGKKLLLYGPANSPVLSAAAPLRFERSAKSGFPPRYQIAAVDKSLAMFAGEKMATHDFGFYYQTSLGAGTVLASYSNGSPALAENTCGNGLIMQSATGLGTGWFDSPVFYDRFLLKTVGWLAGRDVAGLTAALNALEKRYLKERAGREDSVKKPILAAAGIRDGLDYRVGASQHNFGRFGWLIGEGLLCGNISRDLTLSNGDQSFRYETDAGINIGMPQWHWRIASGEVKEKHLDNTVQPFGCVWNGCGTVEYTSEMVFAKEWQDKEVFLKVDNGIDDIDVTEVNGRVIGRTTESTPEYWLAPRKYRIPGELVKWGAVNQIKIKVTNLRDSARINSCPKLVVGSPKRPTEPAKIQVESVDWTHKVYRVTDGKQDYRLWLSLLSPFVLYDFRQQQNARFSLENIARYATWRTSSGLRTVDLQRGGVGGEFFRLDRDGRWSAPWLLLWRDAETKPLLLIFQHQPTVLRGQVNGEIISGVDCDWQGADNRVALGWPWGAASVMAADWGSALPEKVAARLDRLTAMTLNFPIGCQELYALDRTKKRVRMVNRFIYMPINDDWRTEKRAYAFLPPLAGLAREKQMLVETADNVDFELPTKFGPLRGAEGKDWLCWSLPLSGRDDLLFANINAEKGLRDEINTIFRQGIKWSCGGNTPVSAWTPAHPAGDAAGRNIDPFAWSFGLTNALQGYFTVDAANREQLVARVRARYLEPLELYQYKNFARHRQEPFSGFRYPILFNSYYPNHTRYASGFGSKVIYGDSNEACTVSVWVGQMLGDAFGMAGMVRANWSYYRYIMRYMLSIDDWAYCSGSCREFGVGSWIDMLACEYACLKYYAGLAELAGDHGVAEEADYRAAKRMLPTLMRLYFHDYMVRQRLVSASKPIAMVTGFNEDDGAVWMAAPPEGENFYWANDLFDFSQGFPGALYQLYRQNSRSELGQYLTRYALPALAGEDGKFAKAGNSYLQPLAYFYPTSKDLDAWTFNVLAARKKFLMNDWPGMRIGTDIGAVIWRKNDCFSVTEYRQVLIRRADYDPVTKTAQVEYQGHGSGSIIAVSCERAVGELTHNGNVVNKPVIGDDGRCYLPVVDGDNRVTIRFSR